MSYNVAKLEEEIASISRLLNEWPEDYPPQGKVTMEERLVERQARLDAIRNV